MLIYLRQSWGPILLMYYIYSWQKCQQWIPPTIQTTSFAHHDFFTSQIVWLLFISYISCEDHVWKRKTNRQDECSKHLRDDSWFMQFWDFRSFLVRTALSRMQTTHRRAKTWHSNWVGLRFKYYMSDREIIHDKTYPLHIRIGHAILLMDKILHQLIGSLSHYVQGFIHTRRCRISSINSITKVFFIKQNFHIEFVSFTKVRVDGYAVSKCFLHPLFPSDGTLAVEIKM